MANPSYMTQQVVVFTLRGEHGQQAENPGENKAAFEACLAKAFEAFTAEADVQGYAAPMAMASTMFDPVPTLALVD